MEIESKSGGELILHVGTEKTGTTSIQKIFWENRAQLKNDGLRMMECLGSGPNIRLTAACAKFTGHSPVHKVFGIDSKQKHLDHCDILKSEVASELLTDSPERLFISDEHINVHLRSIEELYAIRGYFPNYFVGKVVIYFRRQDYLLESIISESVKNLSYVNDSTVNLNEIITQNMFCSEEIPIRYDYEKIISNLFSAFPEAEIIVRGYDDNCEGFDSVTDIAHSLGVHSAIIKSTKADMNRRIPRRVIDALIKLGCNSHGHINKSKWRKVVKLVSEKYEGSVDLLTDQQRDEFLSRFDKINERLCQKFESLHVALKSDCVKQGLKNEDQVEYRDLIHVIGDTDDTEIKQLLGKVAQVTREESASVVVANCPLCAHRYTFDQDSERREGPLCPKCNISGRASAIINALSNFVGQENIALVNHPLNKDVSIIGLSDSPRYAQYLADKYNYTNTYFHKEPYLDIRFPAEEHRGKYDVVISTEVFEHVLGDVTLAFDGAHSLLKPGGIFIFTVPFVNNGAHKEHYPGLVDYNSREVDGKWVADLEFDTGVVQTDESPIFHGGPGITLEVRLFTRDSVLEYISAAGFIDIEVQDKNYPELGIKWGLASRLITAKKSSNSFVNSNDSEEVEEQSNFAVAE